VRVMGEEAEDQEGRLGHGGELDQRQEKESDLEVGEEEGRYYGSRQLR